MSTAATFCGNTSAAALTDAEIRDRYTDGEWQGLLPTSLPQLNDKGLVDEEWLQRYVQGLETSGKLARPPLLKDTVSTPFTAPDAEPPTKNYVESEQQLQRRVKEEYCFYERRYFAALSNFLDGLVKASIREDPQANVNRKLELARLANQRVTVLTQIVNAISRHRYGTAQGFQRDINNMNNVFGERARQLAEQSAILNKETAGAELHKRMVDYTTEKNKANTNMLTMYAMLNVVAISILIYVSR